jgi:hypothetical protein
LIAAGWCNNSYGANLMSPTYLRRLERKSPPEVVAAYREGKLSVRSVQVLPRLSPRRQLSFLRDRQAVVEQHTERCRRLSELINGYLDTHSEINLESLREILALT